VSCDAGTAAAQLTVTVVCNGTDSCAMAGDYVAGDAVDSYGTHTFMRSGDPTWRIHNTGCGWNVEQKQNGIYGHDGHDEWQRKSRTYKGQCVKCTGDCLSEAALNADTMYDGFGLVMSDVRLSKFNSPNACVACPVDTFSNAGATSCVSCAHGTSTNGRVGKACCTASPPDIKDYTCGTGTGGISEGIDCFTTPNTNLALCKRWIQCRDSGGQQCDDGNGNLGTILKMYNKGITGNIPGADLAMMTHLTELWLYANPLTGQIPNEIGLLTKLTMLSSGHNQMVGAGPGICAIAGNLKHCQIGGSWTNPSLCPTCLNTGQCSQTLARSNFGGCTKVTDSQTAPAPSMVGLSIVFCFVLLLVLCLFLH